MANEDDQAWFFGEGLELPVAIEYDTSLATDAFKLALEWHESRKEQDVSKLSFKATDLESFNSNQKVVFLERLSDIGGSTLPATHIAHLDTTYAFNSTTNVEIRLRWYNLVLESPGASSYTHDAAAWLVDPAGLKGRMKFCRPVFKALSKVDERLAKKTFKANSKFFHPIARKLIEKVSWQG